MKFSLAYETAFRPGLLLFDRSFELAILLFIRALIYVRQKKKEKRSRETIIGTVLRAVKGSARTSASVYRVYIAC